MTQPPRPPAKAHASRARRDRTRRPGPPLALARAALACAALACAALTWTAGCTFEDGSPWGRLDVHASAVVDPAGRQTAEGLLRTNRDYRVALLEFSVEPAALTVRQQPPGEALGFDPARPPEGYTLCHNGHCHASDGRLVDYADVILELTGSAPAAVERVATFERGAVVLSSVAAPIMITDCTMNCELPRGEIVGADLELTRWSATFRVTDSLTGDAARLPEGGILVEVDSDERLTATTPLEIPVDHGHLPTIRLTGELAVPATLFDTIDFQPWAALGPEQLHETARQVLLERLAEVIELRLGVTRTALIP